MKLALAMIILLTACGEQEEQAQELVAIEEIAPEKPAPERKLEPAIEPQIVSYAEPLAEPMAAQETAPVPKTDEEIALYYGQIFETCVSDQERCFEMGVIGALECSHALREICELECAEKRDALYIR